MLTTNSESRQGEGARRCRRPATAGPNSRAAAAGRGRLSRAPVRNAGRGFPSAGNDQPQDGAPVCDRLGASVHPKPTANRRSAAPPRRAGFPAVRYRGVPAPRTNPDPESPVNRPAGKPALPAPGSISGERPFWVFRRPGSASCQRRPRFGRQGVASAGAGSLGWRWKVPHYRMESAPPSA